MSTQHSTTDLLRSADGGPAVPDHAAIARRGQRLAAYRAATRVAGAAVAIAALAGATLLVLDGPTTQVPIIGEPPQQDATPTEPTPGDGFPLPGEDADIDAADTAGDRPTPSGGPSQSQADAQRDGIHPEIAARSFADRVDVERASAGTGPPRVVTDEGVWVVSRIPFHFWEDGTPLVGEPDGLYGRDLIDLDGYGEVLLLDRDETRILRAFPFPDLGPQTLLVTDDAVYCARQGDGGLPDSMLCRIDRRTFAWSARIFPSSLDGAFPLYYPDDLYLPDTWDVDDAPGEVLFEELRLADDALVTIGHDGQRRVDPVTLELIGPTEPAVTSSDRWYVERFLEFAGDPTSDTAAAVRFADEVAIGLGPTLHTTVAADDLTDPAAWVVDEPGFRARVGPFSPLELAATADEPTVTVGPHDHCASPPVPPPNGFEAARRISLQPDLDRIDTCLRWWTVDLFLDEYGDVAAVTMDLWEP